MEEEQIEIVDSIDLWELIEHASCCPSLHPRQRGRVEAMRRALVKFAKWKGQGLAIKIVAEGWVLKIQQPPPVAECSEFDVLYSVLVPQHGEVFHVSKVFSTADDSHPVGLKDIAVDLANSTN